MNNDPNGDWLKLPNGAEVYVYANEEAVNDFVDTWAKMSGISRLTLIRDHPNSFGRIPEIIGMPVAEYILPPIGEQTKNRPWPKNRERPTILGRTIPGDIHG